MNPRTPNDVMKRVGEIQNLQQNPVAAHAAEDNLYYQILLSIANGEAEDHQNMCKQAIKSQNIKFARNFHESN